MVTGSYSYLSFVCFETSQIYCVKLYNYSIWQYLYKLKEHCHEISDTFFIKTPSEPHMNRQKRFHKIFVREDIYKKRISIVNDLLTRCQHSQRLRRHYVSVVNSYRHDVSVVNDCADMV